MVKYYIYIINPIINYTNLDNDMVTLLFSMGFVINRLIGVTVPYINYFFLIIFNLLPQVLIGVWSLFVAYIYSITPVITDNFSHAEILNICDRESIHTNFRISVI